MEFQWHWNDINGPRSTLGSKLPEASFRASSSAEIGVSSTRLAFGVLLGIRPRHPVSQWKEPRQNKKHYFFFWREKNNTII